MTYYNNANFKIDINIDETINNCIDIDIYEEIDNDSNCAYYNAC